MISKYGILTLFIRGLFIVWHLGKARHCLNLSQTETETYLYDQPKQRDRKKQTEADRRKIENTREEGGEKRESTSERPRLSAVSSDYPSLSKHPRSSNDSSSSHVNIHRIRDTHKPSETIPSLQQLSPHAQHFPFHLILHKTKAPNRQGAFGLSESLLRFKTNRSAALPPNNIHMPTSN